MTVNIYELRFSKRISIEEVENSPYYVDISVEYEQADNAAKYECSISDGNVIVLTYNPLLYPYSFLRVCLITSAFERFLNDPTNGIYVTKKQSARYSVRIVF